MYKIIALPLIWWPVTFAGATESGEVIENQFEMRFRIMGEDEHRAFLIEAVKEESLTVEDGTMTAPSAAAAQLVQQIAMDWRGVAAENGEALKFETEHLRQLLNVPNAFTGVMRAYAACRAGRIEVRTGN